MPQDECAACNQPGNKHRRPADQRSKGEQEPPTQFRSCRGAPTKSMARLAAVAAASVMAVALLVVGNVAQAAIVPAVPLLTSSDFAVLAGTTVTNTGPSILNNSVGVSPGSAIVGFPPGVVQAPGTAHAADGVAAQAQNDLTNAYNNAAGRPVDVNLVNNELGGLTLVGGVYTGPVPSLQLTGQLTLDGAGDPNSVFIFQAGSTLTTASASSVRLINGAQECNVFWQVGSSATLGTNSDFSGNILALTSITVTTGTTVHGRALARNGAVTLDTNTFFTPTCDLTPPTTTTTAPPEATTVAAGATTAPPGATTAPPGATTAPPGAATTAVGGTPTAPRAGTPSGPVMPPGTPRLVETGTETRIPLLLALAALGLGAAAIVVGRPRNAR